MIQDYAIIGGGRSCALAAKTGSIDFLCWPRFDSDACFAALLGDLRRGYWLISPTGYVSDTTRCYRHDTATASKMCVLRQTHFWSMPKTSNAKLWLWSAIPILYSV